MIRKSIFNVKFTMSFLMAVLFTAALVTAGCSSSDKDEKAEEAEVTESVEVKEAPPQEEAEAEPEERRPTGPPQELIDACKDLNAGDDCSLTLPADRGRGGSEREYVGTCTQIRTGDMACMPKMQPGKAKWKTPAPESAEDESAEDSDQEAGETN